MESTETTTRPRLHLAHIDGLRALCALWVLLFHALDASRRSAPFALRWITWGHFAVPAFIAISGFCLMMPVVQRGEIKGGAKQFYWRRVRRILPPYYAALLLFIVMHQVTSRRQIISHLLLLHNLSPDTFHGNINASFWSIAVESQIYILFPLFILLWRRAGTVRGVGAALIVSYLANAALIHTSLWGLCLHYIGLFAVGAAGAVCAFSAQAEVVRFRERLAWPAAAFFLTLLLFALMECVPFPRDGYPMNGMSGLQISAYNLFIAAIVACLLVAATLRDNVVRRALSWTPLVWLGSFSYSLYLLHQPLVLWFWRRFAANHHLSLGASVLLFLFVVVPGIIGASYLFHRLFERPFMTGAPKTDRQAEQAAIDSPAP